METIKEAAMKANFSEIDIHSNTALACKNAHKLFEMGVSWAERWIPVEEELPDFKEHKYVLGRNENQNGFYYAIVYDMKVLKTCYTHWRPINHE